MPSWEGGEGREMSSLLYLQGARENQPYSLWSLGQCLAPAGPQFSPSEKVGDCHGRHPRTHLEKGSLRLHVWRVPLGCPGSRRHWLFCCLVASGPTKVARPCLCLCTSH